MYDNIKFKVEDNTEVFKRVLSALFSSQHFKPKFHRKQYLLGEYKNFEVYKKGQVLIFTGSLTKLIEGDNCTNTTKNRIIRAISALQSELLLPSNTKVFSLEFGYNLSVEKSPRKYIKLFEYAMNYSKWVDERPGMVVFCQDLKKLRFYNKERDYCASIRYVELSKVCQLNLLRYEVVINQPKKVLNLTQDLTLVDLYSDKIINQLDKFWFTEFQGIVFNTNLRYDYPITTENHFCKHIMLQGIQKMGGLINVIRIIDSLDFKNHISQYRSRLKKKMLVISGDGAFSKKNNLIEELNNKMFLQYFVNASSFHKKDAFQA